MPSDGNDITSKVFASGFPQPLHGDGKVYEAQVGSATEEVRGLILIEGTAAYQLKLSDGSATPVAIGLKQKFAPGTVAGKVDPDTILDGDPIRSASLGLSKGTARFRIGGTVTAVTGGILSPSPTEAGYCFILPATTSGWAVGICQEAVTTGSGETAIVHGDVIRYYQSV